MIEIKEHQGRIRVGFNEKFSFGNKEEVKELFNKFLDYKEKYTQRIIAEQVSEEI